MEIIRADHLGMCFGVRDAIKLAETTGRTRGLTILGELVHNERVLEKLRAEGIRLARSLPEAETSTVMITAHGASEKTIQAAASSGKEVLQATCPLVHVAHRALRSLVQAGYHPVIVGRRDHVEVRGMTDDLAEFNVVLTEPEILDLPSKERFGVVAQTTQPIERVRHLVGLLRWRFPESEVRFLDTVCQPTKQRQNAAAELASRVDVVIIVGGAHSNNTAELSRTCLRHCARVHQVESALELRIEWLAGAARVGLTAGTSTPDEAIDEVEQRLRALGEIRSRPFERVEVSG